MKKFLKIFGILISIFAILIAIPITLYIFVLPQVVSNPKFLDYVQETVKKEVGAELIVEKPVLKTAFNPNIGFTADEILLTKNGETLLSIKKLDSSVSFSKILLKQIVLNKLGADDIFADVNKLQTLTLKEGEEQKPSEYEIYWFNSILYLKKCMILYRPDNRLLVKVLAKDLEITKEKEPKYVHFKILTDIEYDNQRFRLMFRDFDRVYIKDKKLVVDDFRFIVDKSMVAVDGYIDKNNKYTFDVTSKNFNVNNVKQALDSNLIIPNGKEVLACFKDLNGSFNFNLNLSNKGIQGNINVNKINAKLIPVANLPFTVTKGLIKIDPKNIEIKDIKGFYGSRKANNIDISGTVKNYMKTADTVLAVTGVAEDEFARYVSKIAGCKLNLVGLSKFALRVDYDISGKVVVAGGAKIPKGSDLLIEKSSISSNKFDRALGIKLIMKGQDLEIEHLNYYISDTIAEGGRPMSKPLVSIKSKINIVTGAINELAFDIPEVLPSEFFNVLVNQNLFKRGTFKGKLKYINHDKNNPYIDSDINFSRVIIVGTGLFIRNADIVSDRNYVHIKSEGSIRRAKYNLDGIIQNRMLFPIIVQNVDMTFDELDIDRVMQSFAPRPPLTPEQIKLREQRMAQLKITRSDVPTKYFEVERASEATTNSNDVEQITFMPNLVAIKSCKFHVNKGHYKLLNFGNLHANLTLTPKGILEIKSNKFDFADGISTLKVYCDLAKQKYSVRLGAKDVDSDAISSSVLNLPKEISGKASALLEFYTDKDMKLNGQIRFAINNGSIAKLGLVQYILNVAAIFRNPIVMVSPTTILDIVNVPEGTFKKINGTIVIRNNIAERMMIKSSSPQLSAFIIGQLNLENMDASLRIYTKFSNKRKGFTGFLRRLSLETLAHQMPFNSKEQVSYYAAELSQLPELETGESTAQVFLTKVDGDIQTNNFVSSLKKIK